MYEAKKVDKASWGQIGLRGKVEKEVHHCVTHVRIVDKLKKILLLSSSTLLIVLVFLL
jgi:hypothetical protein